MSHIQLIEDFLTAYQNGEPITEHIEKFQKYLKHYKSLQSTPSAYNLYNPNHYGCFEIQDNSNEQQLWIDYFGKIYNND